MTKHPTPQRWRRWLAAGLAACAAGLAQAATWSRYDSEHFTLYTERESRVASDLLRQLEDLHWLGQMYLGGGSTQARPRFAIYELRGRQALQSIFPGMRDYVDGVYTWCHEGAVAYSVQGDWGRQDAAISWGQTVLQHEYAHHLMFSQFTARYPAWFVEGFAEYLSQTWEQSGQLLAGAPNAFRTQRDASGLSAQELLAWSRRKSAQNDHDFVAFYAKAWQLTHFLLTDPQRAARLNPYFERLAKDEDPVASFEAEFGITMEQLERELYKNAARPLVVKIPLSAIPTSQIQAVPLPTDAGAYLLEESRLRTCGHQHNMGPQLLSSLRQAGSATGASFEARRAAARAEMLVGDPQVAVRQLDALLESQPDDAEAQYLLGRSWTALALAQKLTGEALSDAQAQARAALMRSYRLRKNDAPTLYFLALALKNESPPANALNAARGARRLAPAVPPYVLLDVELEMRAGDTAAAERALLPLTLNTDAPVQTERARKALAALRAGGSFAEVSDILNGATAAPAAPANPS